MAHVLVTGAAGNLGPTVIEHLHRHGHDITAFAPMGAAIDTPMGVRVVGGDVRKRSDVEPLVAHVDVVVHLATSPQRRSVDLEGTTQVAYACTERDAHLIHLSMVGVDQSRFPYYRTRFRTERILANIPGLAWTVQRITHLHPTVQRLVSAPVIAAPGDALLQPVAPTDVARRIAELVETGAQKNAPDFAGPAILSIDDLAAVHREVRATAGRAVSVPRVNLFREMADGLFTLRDGHGDRGLVTWRSWLSEPKSGR